MRARPAGISDDDIRTALSQGWSVEADSVTYSAVGAGSYHWIATDRDGQRYFVTVDHLSTKPWLGANPAAVFRSLRRCYESAWRLRHEAGLEFVVAPLRGAGDTVIERLTERFSMAVFSFVKGRGIGHFDTPPEARVEIVKLLARLHAAGGWVKDVALTRRSGLPGRDALEGALAAVNEHWSSGPFAESAREWLAANSGAIATGLRAYDALVDQVVSAGATAVITHGEPHAGNFVRVNGALALVDWDTVAFAPPERDLWLSCRGNGSEAAELYQRLTGRAVDPAAIHLFTIGWELTDIALYLADLRNEHVDSDDTRRALSVLRGLDVAGLA